MKACSCCARLYPPDAGFCPIDGTRLQSATDVPVVPSDHDRRIGVVFHRRYQIRRMVADGGMGRVYEALDMAERRNVALKILHPDVAHDEVAVQRFRREYEVSNQLPHEHIVEVLDFQPTGDGSFGLVMEYLYGEELRATLKREQVIPPERLVRMMSQMALALDEAHSRKLVHRDLKPDNVFLCQTPNGDIVKILDFGSVKDKADNAKKLTVLGTTIGSPFYMAPEQAQGLDTLDHRADVWALAAITYECMTGQVPFQGSSGPSILLEILTKEPKPASVVASDQRYPVPRSVDRVMAHAFDKTPSSRIASVGAFADALGAAYGLDGTHRAWAHAPQDGLALRIQATLPRLLQSPVTVPDVVSKAPSRNRATEVLPDPFAEATGADDFGAPVPGSPNEWSLPRPERSASANDASDELPLVVPTNSAATWVAVLVAACALVIGVVLTLVLL